MECPRAHDELQRVGGQRVSPNALTECVSLHKAGPAALALVDLTR